MPEFLTDGDEIEFHPQGWQWAGEGNGTLTVKATRPTSMRIKSRPVIVEADLRRLTDQFPGQKYTTELHQAVGRIGSAIIEVDPTTLAGPCRLRGDTPAVRTTSGTFQVTCIQPACDPSSGAVDAVLIKSGKWNVKSRPQDLARSVCTPRAGADGEDHT